MHIQLTQRPRISQINFYGVKKNERDDLKEKLGLVKDNQLTPNMIDRAKILGERYFSEKGYKNAEINIVQKDDASAPDKIIVDVNVERKDKVKINKINIIGNKHLSTRKIKGNIIKPGVLKTIHEKRSMASWFRSKKFVEAKYKEAKENLLTKYGELGFRDAIIIADSVVPHNDQDVNIYISIEEGQKYYIRNIEWVGNTLYPTDVLNKLLQLKKGDVYNQTLMNERLMTDEDAVGNLYYNNGYVFSRIDPVETNIVVMFALVVMIAYMRMSFVVSFAISQAIYSQGKHSCALSEKLFHLDTLMRVASLKSSQTVLMAPLTSIGDLPAKATTK